MPKSHFSQSELYLWHHDKDAYIHKYVEGIEEEMPRRAVFGGLIHKSIEKDTFPVFEELKKQGFTKGEALVTRKVLDKVYRAPEREVPLFSELKGVKFIAVLDGLDRPAREMHEYKTTDNPNSWTQHRVDYLDQISFYVWVWRTTFHSFLRAKLHRINTKSGAIKVYETSRGIRDINFIQDKVFETISDMKTCGVWEKRLSRKEREEKLKVERGESLV